MNPRPSGGLTDLFTNFTKLTYPWTVGVLFNNEGREIVYWITNG